MKKKAASATPGPSTPPVRRDILDRAALLMMEKGFGGMSVRDLAETLEFSKANIFYHVRSKEQLLYEVIAETLRSLLGTFQDIVGRRVSPAVKLRAIVDVYVRLMTDSPAGMVLWFTEQGNLTPDHQMDVARLEAQITQTLDGFYGAGTRTGDFKTFGPISPFSAIFGMSLGLSRWPHLHRPIPLHHLSAQMQDLACHGLLADPPRPARRSRK